MRIIIPQTALSVGQPQQLARINGGASTGPYSAFTLAADFKAQLYRQARTRTNVLTCYNANPNTPVGTVGNPTGMTGHLAGLCEISVVDDTAELALAGLSGICTSGKVYKAVNTDTVLRTITFLGAATDASAWSGSCYVRGTGNTSLRTSSVNVGIQAVTPHYERIFLNSTATAVGTVLQLRVDFGSTIYFILPQFEKAPTFSNVIETQGTAASVTENVLASGPVRSNLLMWSNDYTQSNWTKTDTTVSYANAILSPTYDPMALVAEGSAGTAVLTQAASVYFGAVTVTGSVDLKRGNNDWNIFSLYDGPGTGTARLWVNLATGALGSTTVSGTAAIVGSTISDLGNGFYRVAFTATLSTSNANVVFETRSAAANASLTRVNGATRYQGRSQLEIGSAATAYIGPTDASGTRCCAGGVADLYGYSYTGSGARGYLNSDGTISWFPAVVPPITKDGYQAYGAFTNLLLQSQTFDNASWTKSNLTVTANATAAPDGTLTADALVDDAASSTKSLLQNQSKAASATQYTASYFVKPGSNSWVQVLVYDSTTDGTRVWFNLSGAGSVGSQAVVGAGFTGISPSIKAVANGWYFVTVTFTTNTATTVQSRIVLTNTDGNNTYVGTSSIATYIWQTQLVAGSQAGPLIVTTTATAAIGASVLNVRFDNSDAAGDFSALAVANLQETGVAERLSSLHDGTTTNRFYFSKTATVFNAAMNTGGVVQTVGGSAAHGATLGRQAFLIARQSANVIAGVKKADGTVVLGTASATPPSWPTTTVVEPGSTNSGNHLNGPIEFFSFKRGSPSNTDLTNMLQAA